MPQVRIALHSGKTAAHRQAIGEAVHRAMVETINVPALDRFQIITEHSADELIYDPTYLNVNRTTMSSLCRNWSFGNGEAQYAT